MNSNIISVINIKQLKDNYSYLITNGFEVIIIDPSESPPIIDYIKKNKLSIKAILLTHHHADHTSGVKKILEFSSTLVYSPSNKIVGTSKVLYNNDNIDLGFIDIQVISSPGHTLDHLSFYNEKNKFLFSGDALFRLGCGRVFEGTNQQMYKTLKLLNNLDNDTSVYCGHEYTINNLKFLLNVFPNNKKLKEEEMKILLQIDKTGSSIPFNLGLEKELNPFLSSQSTFYSKFKDKENLTSLEMFSYLRDLKNNF